MRTRYMRVVVSLIALPLVAAACSRASERGEAPVGGSAPAESVQIGQLAPDFTLPSSGGGSVTLSSFKEHRPVLLYFSMGPG